MLANPTPLSVLNGSFSRALQPSQQKPDVVVIFPRRPEFHGIPSFQSVTFSVNGKIGPYLKDVIKGRVEVDGAGDEIFEGRGWRTTNWMIDVRLRIWLEVFGRSD